MDFLNQFSKQISELFRSMTPGSRIAVGLLLAVLVVSMVFLFSGKVVKSGQYLFAGESFSVTQIQRMEAAFAAEGLSDSTIEGSKIRIKGNKADYLAALVKHKALPAGCYDAVSQALSDSSVFQLPSQFNVSIQNARSDDLGKMISQMHMIEWAQVMCFREKTRSFAGKERCSATVTVGTVLGETVNAKLAKTIQQTAAGALGIPAADITVADARTSRSFSGNLSSGNVADNELKSDYEAEWVEKIQNLLSIPGMTVAVNVELDPYKYRREVKVTPDKKPVTKSSYNKTTKSDRKAPAPGGRPGFSSNQPNRLIQTANQMSTDSEKDSESISDNIVGGEQMEAGYATGRPKQVNVSIRIPTDYFTKIWESRNPTPEGEEPATPTAAERDTIAQEQIAEAKQSVANLLSAEGVQDPAKYVNVTTYESLTPPPVAAPGMMDKATVWFGQYWTVVGLFVLGFFSLRMLKKAMQSVPVEIAELEEDNTIDQEEADEMASQIASEMLHKFEGSGPSLRDELSALVNQDTDAAATILRTWIGSGSSK